MQSTIFNIQHFSVHDGPGIRTSVFFKGCPLQCQWCCNPESQSRIPELRYKEIFCKKCGHCARACAVQAIALTEAQGQDGLKIDRSFCKDCSSHDCVEACNYNALSLCGENISVEELMQKLSADKAFYENSGGGVTFTGGEPFCQASCLHQLLQECRSKGISTAVQTCGYYPLEILQASCEFIDVVMFDLKAIDSDLHLRLTGVPNAQILQNYIWLARNHPHKLCTRLPLIPGCNMEMEHLEQTVAFLKQNGINYVELQFYHSLGESKYKELSMPILYKAPEQIISEKARDPICSFFTENGIKVKVLF